MRPIEDLHDYRRCVAAISRISRLYTTNSYAAGEQLENWFSNGRLNVVEEKGAILFLLIDRNFRRVFHVAEDHSALSSALASLPAGTYVTDLVGQGANLNRLNATYASAGFVRHTFLCRMTLGSRAPAQSGIYFANSAAEVASVEDVPEIAALLERLLDPFSEQLPDAAELERAAKAGHLLFVRIGQAIAGMLMYDLKSQMAHLRLWHVDSNARGEGIGRKLMNAFLARTAEARRTVLWVIGDNSRSIDIYRHYGFTEDGLLDEIMILRKEST